MTMLNEVDVKKRMEELKTESQSLDEQAQKARETMATIQRSMGEIDARRFQVVAAYKELESVLGNAKPLKIADEGKKNGRK